MQTIEKHPRIEEQPYLSIIPGIAIIVLLAYMFHATSCTTHPGAGSPDARPWDGAAVSECQAGDAGWVP